MSILFVKIHRLLSAVPSEKREKKGKVGLQGGGVWGSGGGGGSSHFGSRYLLFTRSVPFAVCFGHFLMTPLLRT